MIVLDANILIDALFEKNEERRNLALDLFQAIKGKTVYVPRIFIVEVVSIAKRLGIGLSLEELFTLVERFNIKEENEIFNLAVYIAENVHPRAVDSYYIATAILTGSIVISNDKTLVKNCKKAGIKAFYLVEEHKEALNYLNKYIRS
ncbi:type II toxin-antitoxin system VapC family toxin [Thermococcus barophilus]|uniref:PIN domain-containing protein n=1 Tax=Thermococcus barophilus (strain DSM 11836 / MP) TaxID=391623 RepID=F0LLJ7_THEBM|nr:type II toxin-antitoxin system VapC family toxin [Thermococcus barophilus]ADT85026.1 hypothetical protein TERMP_02052 [Thermococcus barophilus MP]